MQDLTGKTVSDAPGSRNHDEDWTVPNLSPGSIPHSFEIQVRAISSVKATENDGIPSLTMLLLRIRTEWVAIVLLAVLLGITLACTLFPVRTIMPVYSTVIPCRLAHDLCVAARCCNSLRLDCKEYAPG